MDSSGFAAAPAWQQFVKSGFTPEGAWDNYFLSRGPAMQQALADAGAGNSGFGAMGQFARSANPMFTDIRNYSDAVGNKNTMQDITGLAAILGMAGAGALAFGGAGAGTVGGVGAEVDPMMYGGGDAGTWGAGGVADSSLAAPNTAAMGAAGNPWTQFGVVDTAFTPGQINVIGDAAAGGAAGGAVGAAGGGGGGGAPAAYGGGFDPSLFNAANTPANIGPFASAVPWGSLAKYGLPLLGAALGSQPQKTTQTASKEPWGAVVPYLTSPGGLFDSASQTFNAQKNNPIPGALQTAGLGLLAQPVAPNGFSRFFPGR
jgi:hypothetical protein